MNILVLAPMHEEYINFKSALHRPHNNTYKVVECGVGKVEAAATTALELYGTKSAYDLVAVIGYAGGYGLKQGDFIIPSSAAYHDVNCPPDIITFNKVYDLQGNDNVQVLTGDSFITKDNYLQINAKASTKQVLYDMEAAAVCQVAEGIPVVVMKLVSDNPAEDSNLLSFQQFVQQNSDFSQFLYYLETFV